MIEKLQPIERHSSFSFSCKKKTKLLRKPKKMSLTTAITQGFANGDLQIIMSNINEVHFEKIKKIEDN